MRKLFSFIVLFLISVYSFSQGNLSISYLPQVGDEVFKQQVEFKDPGRSGKSVLWDFSQLKTINPKYKLKYDSPVISDSAYVLGTNIIPLDSVCEYEEDRLFIGKEHETSYFYHLRNDSLFCLGHENAVINLWYTHPLLMHVFSSAFQEQTTKPFSGDGLYSMQVPVRTQGTMTIEQDATGMILLPSGDTLKHVSRFKSIQRIDHLDKVENDSTSLTQMIEVETYRWYAKGYRYPVFETVCSYNTSEEGNKITNFTTAFYYPPEDAQHNQEYNEEENNSENDIIDPWEGLTYNVYPNPVSTYVEVEIYLPREANVVALLSSSQGVAIQKKKFPPQPEGIFRFQLDLTGYTRGNYVLDIWLNDHLISEKILKL